MRRSAINAFNMIGGSSSVTAVNSMLRSANPELRRAGLIASAQCQIPIDDALLSPMCHDDDPLRRLALYAAGMNGLPLIERLAESTTVGPRVRGGARWWRRAGHAVVD